MKLTDFKMLSEAHRYQLKQFSEGKGCSYLQCIDCVFGTSNLATTNKREYANCNFTDKNWEFATEILNLLKQEEKMEFARLIKEGHTYTGEIGKVDLLQGSKVRLIFANGVIRYFKKTDLEACVYAGFKFWEIKQVSSIKDLHLLKSVMNPKLYIYVDSVDNTVGVYLDEDYLNITFVRKIEELDAKEIRVLKGLGFRFDFIERKTAAEMLAECEAVEFEYNQQNSYIHVSHNTRKVGQATVYSLQSFGVKYISKEDADRIVKECKENN